MVEIRKIRGASTQEVASGMRSGLDRLGFTGNVNIISSSGVEVRNVRLGDKHIGKHGFNVSSYSGRRARVLNWKDWVRFNKMVNDTLDRLNASANAKSLKGKFVIRKGGRRYTEDDWEDLAYENVGSQMEPVFRKDAWQSEETPKEFKSGRWRKKMREVVE